MLRYLFAMMTMLVGMSGCMSVQAESLSYKLGDSIQDFCFTTYDNQNISLSDILSEKEAVMINLWASWCDPCRSELPYMQEAYEKYQDKVEIIALSTEPNDTSSVMKKMAEEYELTFLIGQDPVDFLSALRINSIPTTMMIDRFGTICLIVSEAQPSTESFERMFNAFTGNAYSESVLYRGIPSPNPGLPGASESELYAALGISAQNPPNPSMWPMLPEVKDGRNVLASSNQSQPNSEAAVSAVINAKRGESIVVTFKTATEQVFDLLKISVNGEVKKVFGGNHDWTDYMLPVEQDGEYIVTVSYSKDYVGDAEEDTVWIDRISVVDSSLVDLQENPFYPPTADEIMLTVRNESAREVWIEDPYGILQNQFGEVRCFVTNSDVTNIAVQLTEEYDPESAFVHTSQKRFYPLTQHIQNDCYTIEMTVDAASSTGYLCTTVYLYPDSSSSDFISLLLFQDEENLIDLCRYNHLGEWGYVAIDKELHSTAFTSQQQSAYTVFCIDQDGEPVAGAMIQVCDDHTCQVFFTDENGQSSFMLAPFAWEIHLLSIPNGYTAVDQNVIIAPVEGGEIYISITKE